MEETTISSVFDELAQDPTNFEYATQGQRFTNYIIDLAAFYIFNTLVYALLGFIMAISGVTIDDIQAIFSNKLCTLTISYVDFFIIYTLIEGATKGRTLGKLITRTKAVQDDNMMAITWKQAMRRTLYRIIPFEPLSALGGTPWHDKYTRTTVIKKNRATM